MTVSRTINGHRYVSAETAKKVRAAIRKLDYRPNHAARMLTGQLSRSIGLIVPDIADTFFSVVSHAVQETARKSGYLVWLAVSNEDPSIEAAQVEMMTNHPVDGILLVPADARRRYLKPLAAGSLPIVTIDRPIEVATTDTVGVENRSRGANGRGPSHSTRKEADHLPRRKLPPVDYQRANRRLSAIDAAREITAHEGSSLIEPGICKICTVRAALVSQSP